MRRLGCGVVCLAEIVLVRHDRFGPLLIGPLDAPKESMQAVGVALPAMKFIDLPAVATVRPCCLPDR
jgi:hypothetical protein